MLIVILIISLVGCNEKDIDDSKQKVKIAVSIPPQEAFVKGIGKELVEVVTMIPPGYSETNYQPKPKDMQALSETQIYFSIGVKAEESNILPKLKDFNSNIKLVKLDEIVGDIYPFIMYDEDNHEDEHDHTGKDPHIWLSPKRVTVMINEIKDELIKVDPENKEYYETNAQDYLKELNDIDSDIKNTLKDAKSRYFIIYHPAFGYFADDYNLEMITIEEEGKEATAKRIREVIDFAKEKNIKIIFYQEEYDKNQAQTIANDMINEIDNSMKKINSGEILKGKVISVSDDEVLVNIGYIADGIISKEELSYESDINPKEIVKTDDEINVYVVKVSDEEGNVILSKRRADEITAWDEIKEIQDKNEVIEVKIKEVVKGGLISFVKFQKYLYSYTFTKLFFYF